MTATAKQLLDFRRYCAALLAAGVPYPDLQDQLDEAGADHAEYEDRAAGVRP